jgi:hypothetical protein
MLTVGDEAVALGNSYEDGQLGAWQTTDGTAWDVIDITALDGYAGTGPVASGADELVIVVYEATPAGLNPRFARWTSTDGWSVEADPVLGTTDSAVVGACPEAPDTALEWAAIPATVATECFGDKSITFEAWLPSVAQDGCGTGAFASDCSPWILEPRWLLDSIEVGIVEANWPAGYAARSPGATGVGERGSWVTLTGHWADPEASACRSHPASMWPEHSLGNPNPPCVGFVVTDISPAP